MFNVLESNTNVSSPEDCSDLKLLNYILIGLLCLSFIVNIVLIICTRIQLKKPKRSVKNAFILSMSVYISTCFDFSFVHTSCSLFLYTMTCLSDGLSYPYLSTPY